MQGKFEAIKALAREAILDPQEQMQAIGKKRESLFIGIPKESSLQENRVALTPGSVNLLVNNGHQIIIETGAGKKVGFTDNHYSEAGAQIAYSAKEVFKAHTIMKVAPPCAHEIELMQPKQVIFSALQMSVQPKALLQKMMEKKVTAIAWEHIKDNTGIFPVVRAMGEIAGNTSILIASEYMSAMNGGSGIMFGGISGVAPTQVVILGAGTVGEFATRAALGLGADVKIFDNSVSKLRRLQNDLGVRLFTSVIQPHVLEAALKSADVVIGAIRSPYGRTPCIVSEAMVEQMKKGAVIVDVSIDQGGCVETSEITTHNNPSFIKHDVIHYGVPNIASRVSRTASQAISNIFAPLLLEMAERGGVNQFLKRDVGFRNGVYLFQGNLTNQVLAEAFHLPYKELNLILPAL